MWKADVSAFGSVLDGAFVCLFVDVLLDVCITSLLAWSQDSPEMRLYGRSKFFFNAIPSSSIISKEVPLHRTSIERLAKLHAPNAFTKTGPWVVCNSPLKE